VPLHCGELEFTPWCSLKVWVYKKVNEMKAPPMKLYTDPGAPMASSGRD
jgi:hypothetical protein